ncbi:hypothetical protein VOLCADRAFT_116873 [Volvox carteri f. nagariensis]|uniref:Mediator of RNA polymerase II transcription subunit 7 n=1 Tax=Volvox carteri f. nagariensis TaxID=3068 RepID=D8TQ58_VOLCA|nr:uncharacterized protein VOLCADRAFT_116873 [Volvox carteri f. nagariensis]EFJ50476.1 hypothetical protein VOLCADRAFT_116873 [Volvox carteri f. nagariensis]|eukprot:XP_002948601.1 hypothetical protein VOLCADRAFT_116873 [Volvox carteri f. nagariensis]
MAAAANNGAAMREAYPPPPSLFNLYRPDDGVSPLPPPPPPIPTLADVAALRERKIELKVLGNPLKLHEDLVPNLTTQALFRQQPDGTVDFKGDLKRLSGELLFMFLELLKAVVEKPSGYAAQLTPVNVLLSNLVQLTNLMRPYQARATLEATLALQVGTMRDSIRRVRQQVTAADEVLKGMARALVLCGNCHRRIIPEAFKEGGLCACITAVGLCASGCWLCACLPFCVNVTKDTVYRCPACNAEIHRRRAPFE